MLNLENISVKEALEHIKNRRIENKRKRDENFKEAEKLLSLDKIEESLKLINKDVLGYVDVYNEAYKKEKTGKLEEASELYWKNIYTNGTDAPANFKRLLIVLRKLGQLSDELKVAEIYLNFISEPYHTEIKKKNQ